MCTRTKHTHHWSDACVLDLRPDDDDEYGDDDNDDDGDDDDIDY